MEDFHCTSWSLAPNSALSVKNSMTDIRKKQCELTIASKMEKDFSSRVYNLLITYIVGKGRKHTCTFKPTTHLS